MIQISVTFTNGQRWDQIWETKDHPHALRVLEALKIGNNVIINDNGGGSRLINATHVVTATVSAAP